MAGTHPLAQAEEAGEFADGWSHAAATAHAVHFEATGYNVRTRDHDGEASVELMRPGYTKPNVLVCCRPGGAGPVSAKVVREFFGTLVPSGVEAGWVVSAAGFADDARELAAERGIELIDGAGLIERLHALDPLALAQVLGRVGA